MRQHRVVNRSAHLHAVVGENRKVVLEVLPDFQNFLGLKDRTKQVDDCLRFRSVGRHSHVPGLAFGYGKAHSD